LWKGGLTSTQQRPTCVGIRFIYTGYVQRSKRWKKEEIRLGGTLIGGLIPGIIIGELIGGGALTGLVYVEPWPFQDARDLGKWGWKDESFLENIF